MHVSPGGQQKSLVTATVPLTQLPPLEPLLLEVVDPLVEPLLLLDEVELLVEPLLLLDEVELLVEPLLLVDPLLVDPLLVEPPLDPGGSVFVPPELVPLSTAPPQAAVPTAVRRIERKRTEASRRSMSPREQAMCRTRAHAFTLFSRPIPIVRACQSESRKANASRSGPHACERHRQRTRTASKNRR